MPYTIGEVARMMNIAPSTLRYYEKEGLLSLGVRASNGQRTYTDDDIATLSIIEYLKFCGLPLRRFARSCRSSGPAERHSAPAATSLPKSATTSARRSRRCKRSLNGWISAAGIMRPRSSTARCCRCMNFQRNAFRRSIGMFCARAFACHWRTCAQSSNGDKKGSPETYRLRAPYMSILISFCPLCPTGGTGTTAPRSCRSSAGPCGRTGRPR